MSTSNGTRGSLFPERVKTAISLGGRKAKLRIHRTPKGVKFEVVRDPTGTLRSEVVLVSMGAAPKPGTPRTAGARNGRRSRRGRRGRR